MEEEPFILIVDKLLSNTALSHSKPKNNTKNKQVEMGTLLHQTVLPLHTQRLKISPWMLKELPTPLPTKKNCIYKARAQGRGFGDSAPKIKNQSKQTQAEEDDDEIPEEVFGRMITRVLIYVGVPMMAGLSLLYVLSVLKQRGVIDVPGWLPLTTILVSFGTSGLGIAFGTLSTSWDPEVEGSFLGLEEMKQNWPVLWKKEEEKEEKR